MISSPLLPHFAATTLGERSLLQDKIVPLVHARLAGPTLVRFNVTKHNLLKDIRVKVIPLVALAVLGRSRQLDHNEMDTTSVLDLATCVCAFCKLGVDPAKVIPKGTRVG